MKQNNIEIIKTIVGICYSLNIINNIKNNKIYTDLDFML